MQYQFDAESSQIVGSGNDQIVSYNFSDGRNLINDMTDSKVMVNTMVATIWAPDTDKTYRLTL